MYLFFLGTVSLDAATVAQGYMPVPIYNMQGTIIKIIGLQCVSAFGGSYNPFKNCLQAYNYQIKERPPIRM